MRDTQLQNLKERQIALYRVDVDDAPRNSRIRYAGGRKILSLLTDDVPMRLFRKPTNEATRRETIGAARRALLDAFQEGFESRRVGSSISFVTGPAELARLSRFDHADLMTIAIALGYGKFTRTYCEPDSERYGFVLDGPLHPIVVFIARSGEAEAISVSNMNPDPYLDKIESMALDHAVMCPGTTLEWAGRVPQSMVDIAFAWLPEHWCGESAEPYADDIASERDKRDRQLRELFIREVAATLEDPIVTCREVDLRRAASRAPATFGSGSLEAMQVLMHRLRIHEVACLEHDVRRRELDVRESLRSKTADDLAFRIDRMVQPAIFVSTAFQDQTAFPCRRDGMREAHIEIAWRIVEHFAPSSSAPRYITTNRASGIKNGPGFLNFVWTAMEIFEASGHEHLDAQARLRSFLEETGLPEASIDELLALDAE